MRSPLRAIDRTLRPDGHVFYGWWIVLAGGGVQMLIGALLMQAFGAYVVLLRDEFGWSLAALSGAFAMSGIRGAPLGSWARNTTNAARNRIAAAIPLAAPALSQLI